MNEFVFDSYPRALSLMNFTGFRDLVKVGVGNNLSE